ncbi:hypothetical protein J4573_38180 [Actinomadura barringtoniae]|uniref:YceI family protein n=1 Tax=Actinomadura barringtoniae TaxID=1427535 RepID=A0A939PIM5_9ACTN|nr:hypothetical protein [Actinomadura barringtoniae]MBO2452972.1 hypothetical protein [Actinomadura barringtoniae]
MTAEITEPPRLEPGTYVLRHRNCVVELTVRVLGMSTRSRFAAVGGLFTVGNEPWDAELVIEVRPSPRRLTGPPIARGVLGTVWPGVARRDTLTLEARRLSRVGTYGFRMRGELRADGQVTELTLVGRFLPSGGDGPILLGGTAVDTRATGWGRLPKARRAMLGRRLRLLIGAEFEPE